MKCLMGKRNVLRNTFSKAKSKYLKQSTVVQIVLFYRYLSLFITSFLYYFSSPHKAALHRLIIISGMLLACAVFTCLYIGSRSSRNNVLVLTLVETFGNSFFIMVSGGYASPYIWYSVSTLFIAAVELPLRFPVIEAAVYFSGAGLTALGNFKKYLGDDIARLYLNIAISYVLVVLGLMLITRYAVNNEEKTVSLSAINEELKDAKSKLEKTLHFSIEIYKTMNIFNLNGSKNILQELLDHARNLTGVEQGMFLRLAPDNKQYIDSYVSHSLTKEEEEQAVCRVKQLLSENPDYISASYCDFKKRRLSVHIVTHGNTPYGVFGAITDEKHFLREISDREPDYIDKEKPDVFERYSAFPIFMEIAGIVLKKLELDDLAEKLLISEEQNRIANEIHDIALQKLFAVSCRLYVLSSKLRPEADMELRDELLEIRRSVDSTMRELREAIYGFSWEKEGEDTFKNKLLKYTDEIRKLQGIEVLTEIIGDTQKIMANQKNGLYRIICEAMNNAVRHGKAKHIHVLVAIEDTRTTVKITDDGEGFDYEEYQKKDNKGIGLSNIYRIVKLLNGKLEIKSQISGGTEIYLAIPSKTAA